MMTGRIIGIVSAKDYFEHEESYYTENQTCYDKWHGSLGKTIGAEGEVSKEQFDHLMDSIAEAKRIRGGLDCPFSAPKSCSLALAANEQTRADMIEAHQAAMQKIAAKIEQEYIIADGYHGLSRNMVAAEFVHLTARPTEANNFIPDLDLHSHLVIGNATYYDGKIRAINYEKILHNYHTLGLEYRRELAHELQARGYELELTDPRQGFFELAGFDRQTIDKYSNRSAEIKEYKEAHPDATDQQAKQLSKSAKDKATKNYEELCDEVRKDLFRGKIQIKKRKVDEHGQENEQRKEAVLSREHERQGREGAERDHQRRADIEQRIRSKDSIPSSLTSNGRYFGARSGSEAVETFATRRDLSDVSEFSLGSQTGRSRMLLSSSQCNRLARLQTKRVRDYYLRRSSEIRRNREIDEIADRAIKRLSDEKWAFTVEEAQKRIMAEGLLENMRKEEAEAALERAEVVRLGRLERDENAKNQYLTTERNIEREASIKESVARGREKILDGTMTQDEARAALHKVEAEAKASGKTDFSIEGGQQGQSVEHVLVSQDQYLAIDGLAGTGKTASMERLSWIAKEQGYTLRGMSLGGTAARNLEAETGIKSDTIHGFLGQLEKESGIEPPQTAQGEIRQEWDFSRVRAIEPGQREIWLVDEAGFLDNNLTYQLQTAAEARGAQVVFMGDPDQLPAVGLGEPLRMMEENGIACARLTEIRRQEQTDLLKAVQESVQGDHLKTYELLEKRGDYREITEPKARREAVRDEMTKDSLDTYKDRLLVVSRNEDRRAYNKAIRKAYVQKGELEQGRKFEVKVTKGDKEVIETREFARNDRIICLSNDKKLGITNGTMGRIHEINGDKITMQIDTKKGEQEKFVTIDTRKYKALEYSYAVTEYKSQGMTVQKVVCDLNTKGAANTRNALYVDISRARKQSIVFTDNKPKLEKQTRQWAKKITSKDFADRISQLRAKDGITNNDRYHAPQRDWGAEMDRALRGVEEHTLGVSKKAVATREAARAATRETSQGMSKVMAAAAAIPIEATGKMLQATGAVCSLVPVVGKVVGAPMQAAGKVMDKAAGAVKKGVKITIQTGEKLLDVTKKVMEIPQKGVDLAKRAAEAGRANEEREQLPQPRRYQQQEHDRGGGYELTL